MTSLGKDSSTLSNAKEEARVGIVIVTYNSAEVFALAMDSLARTKSDTPFIVAVIDNASTPAERAATQATFDKAVSQAGLQGRYFQQQENLGFAGGNNIGIEYCMADAAVTHICLLNSDVIVTDHWLDHLVATGQDAVGPLTNASNNEQGIPIAYRLGDRGNLRGGSASLDLPALAEFSKRRREGWLGLLTETDFLSYYCVLFSRALVERVGTLDERFFPGAYEDDDHCLRILENGYRMHVARDVYIHHWGSASFGKLDVVQARGYAATNRARFEEKHGRRWRDRTRLSATAWMQDSLFAIASAERLPIHLETHRLYTVQMRSLVDGLEAYRRHLLGEFAAWKRENQAAPPGPVAAALREGEPAPPSLLFQVNAIATDVDQLLSSDGTAATADGASSLKARFEAVIDALEALATQTSSLALALADLPAPRKTLGGFLRKVKRRLGREVRARLGGGRFAAATELLRLLFGGPGIVFFAGYPTKERERDGYFQRVKAIDSLFPNQRRIYVDVGDHNVGRPFIERVEPDAWVLNIISDFPNRKRAAFLLALRYRRVYFHSVLRMANGLARAVVRIPGLRWVLDVHGVVPEEFRMHDDFFSARIHDACEETAARRADCMIVVSRAMGDYLEQKYRDLPRPKIIVLPIFSLEGRDVAAPRPYRDGRPTVIYAGGTHKWQNIPDMLDAVSQAVDRADWWIYTPDVDTVRLAAPETVRNHPNFLVKSATRAELNGIYPQCHFGFILRDDIVVNNVSCPTKLIEYLAFGIVPIIDTPRIGDFHAYGMRFVHVDDFARGLIPDAVQRMEMAEHNRRICERLVEQKLSGEQQLVEVMG